MADTRPMHNFSFGNSTHVGQVRKTNEDYFGSFDTPNGYVFIVCDGMGGHAGGARASQIAVNAIRDVLFSHSFPDPAEALSKSIVSANEAILRNAGENPELKGMGSTCVAILVSGSDVWYAHVGDSRIYLFSGGHLHQITRDHSFVQMLVDKGEITDEEAERHPRKNEITNALGLQNMRPPTVCQNPVNAVKGDIFLLCSDGLTGMVSNHDIELVLKSSDDVQDKAVKLVELANIAGGKDNITVQVIQFQRSEYRKTENIPGEKKTKKSRMARIIIILTVLAVAVAVAAFFFISRRQ